MKPLRILLMAMVFLSSFLVATCQQPVKESEITIIDKTQLTELLAESPNILIVDVRTSDEVAAGKIPGSVNYDWFDQESFSASVQELDKSKPIVVYCMSGTRSGKAAAHLASAGFLKVYDYSEGYVGWSSN